MQYICTDAAICSRMYGVLFSVKFNFNQRLEIAMSNLNVIVETSKAIKIFYDNTKTIITYKDAVDRVQRRKEPFPPPKEAQKLLDSNARLEKRLKSIADFGIPDPTVPNIDIEELLNPPTKPQALDLLRETLEIRTEHQNAINKRISDFKNLASEADIKSQAARDISNFWDKMMRAPLPDIGTVNKATYFSFNQLFQKLSSSLKRVAKAARFAKKRIEDDLKDYSRGSDNMRSNLKTFGVLRR